MKYVFEIKNMCIFYFFNIYNYESFKHNKEWKDRKI